MVLSGILSPRILRSGGLRPGGLSVARHPVLRSHIGRETLVRRLTRTTRCRRHVAEDV